MKSSTPIRQSSQSEEGPRTVEVEFLELTRAQLPQEQSPTKPLEHAKTKLKGIS